MYFKVNCVVGKVKKPPPDLWCVQVLVRASEIWHIVQRDLISLSRTRKLLTSSCLAQSVRYKYINEHIEKSSIWLDTDKTLKLKLIYPSQIQPRTSAGFHIGGTWGLDLVALDLTLNRMKHRDVYSILCLSVFWRWNIRPCPGHQRITE